MPSPNGSRELRRLQALLVAIAELVTDVLEYTKVYGGVQSITSAVRTAIGAAEKIVNCVKTFEATMVSCGWSTNEGEETFYAAFLTEDFAKGVFELFQAIIDLLEDVVQLYVLRKIEFSQLAHDTYMNIFVDFSNVVYALTMLVEYPATCEIELISMDDLLPVQRLKLPQPHHTTCNDNFSHIKHRLVRSTLKYYRCNDTLSTDVLSALRRKLSLTACAAQLSAARGLLRSHDSPDHHIDDNSFQLRLDLASLEADTTKLCRLIRRFEEGSDMSERSKALTKSAHDYVAAFTLRCGQFLFERDVPDPSYSDSFQALYRDADAAYTSSIAFYQSLEPSCNLGPLQPCSQQISSFRQQFVNTLERVMFSCADVLMDSMQVSSSTGALTRSALAPSAQASLGALDRVDRYLSHAESLLEDASSDHARAPCISRNRYHLLNRVYSRIITPSRCPLGRPPGGEG